MDNFIYNVKTKIIFGKDTEVSVADEIKEINSNAIILLHYGGGSIKKSGLYSKIVNSLQNANLHYIELGGVMPNPRLSLVNEGIKICQEQNVDFILAVGGGSVIDSAKAIALGAVNDEDFWETYFVKREVVRKALPIGTVLTIPAAGSESSAGTVITDEKNERKIYAGGDVLRPKFSILNPELTFTLPAYQSACGASDILAHILERYFSNTKVTDLTDRLCEGAMRSVIENAPKVISNPNDYDFRAEIMLSGLYAHNDCLGVGRVGDWATHDIEHELSAIWDVTHGEGLAVLFPAWMKFVSVKNPRRILQLAERLFDIKDGSDEEKIKLAIESFSNWYKSLGLKTKLSDFSEVSPDKFELMAKRCTGTHPLGNYLVLNKEDVIKILKIAW